MIVKKIVCVVIAIVLAVTILIPITDVRNDSETLNVIIIDGQSNGAYWNICDPSVVQEDYDVVPTHNLYYYGADIPIKYNGGEYDHTFKSYDIHPMWDNGWLIGGYEPILANELSERSNRDTLVINIAIGGLSIISLQPTGAGGIYGFEVIENALSKIEGYDRIDMVGWIWIQGETDDELGIDIYTYGFNDLADKFDSIGAKNCYVVGVRDSYGGNSQIALREIAKKDPNVTFVTDIAETFTEENGLLKPGDPLHFSQKGRDVIATILGNEIPISKYGETPDIIRTFVQLIPVLVIVGLLSIISALFFINRRT